jgi:hypothetical protein
MSPFWLRIMALGRAHVDAVKLGKRPAGGRPSRKGKGKGKGKGK